MCEYTLGFKTANKLPMTECEQYEELLEQFLDSSDLIITKACESRESTISTVAGLMLHAKGKPVEVGYEFNTVYVRKMC